MVMTNGVWSISQYRNAYTGCLSITILPVTISSLTGISLAFVEKLLMPISFALIVIPVYELSRAVFRSRYFAFAACCFFIFQPAVFTTYQLPVRQQIALMFFGGGIVVVVLRPLSTVRKYIAFIVLNTGMILSHYSTAYFAIGVYAIYLVLSLAVFRKALCVEERKRATRIVNAATLVALCLVTFAWYSQVNFGMGGLGGYLVTSFREVPALFRGDSQAPNLSPMTQLDPFVQSSGASALATYIRSTADLPGSLTPVPTQALAGPLHVSAGLLARFFQARQMIIDLGKLALLLGCASIFLKILVRRKLFSSIEVLAVSSVIGMVGLAVWPSSSQVYDFTRAYQQVLIVGAPLLIAGLLPLRAVVGRKLTLTLIGIFVGVYLAALCSVFTAVTGGPGGSIVFQNSGVEYYTMYTHSSDIYCADWLYRNSGTRSIFADTYGAMKLRLATGSEPASPVDTDVFRFPLAGNAWLYADWDNAKLGVIIVAYNESTLVFKFPSEYLSNHTNVIYSNGGACVYSLVPS
jgi:uncharacterized membrane protein